MYSGTHVARREFLRTALGMLAATPSVARASAQDAGGLELSRATQFSPINLDRALECFFARAGVDPI